jgi:hypothetical protein
LDESKRGYSDGDCQTVAVIRISQREQTSPVPLFEPGEMLPVKQ